VNVQEYQKLARRTCATTEPTETMKLTLIGMQGELGEIAEPIKKHLYSSHALDTSHVEQEIGDLLWYLANLCNSVGIDIENAMQRNIEKLERRYPDGFSCERSINRTS
jgi:NTP pyrophosphatase (non-canonical NTP hydrolase)